MLRRFLGIVALGLIICLNNKETRGQYALSFDGIDDYAYYDSAFAPTDIDSGTIEFWVKRTTSWGCILAKESDWSHTKYHVGLGDNNTGLFCQPIGYRYVAYAPNQNEWGHIAFVENDINTTVYINGNNVGILPDGMVINSEYDGADFIIGACNHYSSDGGDQEFFGGIIDEIRIWNTVRTQAEIRGNMYNEIPTNSPGLVGYFKMSNGSGSSLSDDKNAPDNTLTIHGASWVLSTAPIGTNGAYINTTSQTSVGPAGGQIKVTITSTPDDDNNLSVYQAGSISGEPVTGETYPGGLDKRSDIVWGIAERGDVTADLIFDYSNVVKIDTPSTIKLLKRSDASSTTWEEVALTSRDDNARALTVNGVTSFGEFALGAKFKNSLPGDHFSAHYSFNGNANDVSGNGHHGTVYNATLITDRFGNANQAYYFDGDGDYIDIGDWEMGGEMSICVWVKHVFDPDNAVNDWARIFHFGNSMEYDNWWLDAIYLVNAHYADTTFNDAYFGIVGENSEDWNYLYAPDVFSDTEWIFITLVVQGTMMKIYKNSSLAASKTDAHEPVLKLRSHQYLGHKGPQSSDSWLKGSIDDLKIYSRVLTNDEIASLYNDQTDWSLPVTVADENVPISTRFGLKPAYPNPFNPSVTIPYGLAENGQMSLKVYNLRGELVKVLLSTYALKGAYSYNWQPQNLSAGIYLIRMQSGNHTSLQKVVFVK